MRREEPNAKVKVRSKIQREREGRVCKLKGIRWIEAEKTRKKRENKVG